MLKDSGCGKLVEDGYALCAECNDELIRRWAETRCGRPRKELERPLLSSFLRGILFALGGSLVKHWPQVEEVLRNVVVSLSSGFLNTFGQDATDESALAHSVRPTLHAELPGRDTFWRRLIEAGYTAFPMGTKTSINVHFGQEDDVERARKLGELLAEELIAIGNDRAGVDGE